MSLTIGTLDASVTVTGEATVLETARSQIASTVSQTEVRSVPLNGRNFLRTSVCTRKMNGRPAHA